MNSIESKGKTVDEAVFSGLLKMDLSIDEVIIDILDEGSSLFKSARVRLTKKSAEDVAEEMKAREAQTAENQQHKEHSARSPRGGFESGQRRRSSASADRDGRNRRERNQKREEFAEPEADFIPQEPANDAERFLLGLFSHIGIGVRLKSQNEDGIIKIEMSGRGMGLLIGRRGETLDALQYLTSLVVNSGKEDYTKIMLDTEDYRKKREDTLRQLAARLADRVLKSGKRVVLEPMNPYERRIMHATLQDYEKVYTYSEGEDPFRSVVVAVRDDEEEQPENSPEDKQP